MDLITLNIASKESINLVCSKCGNMRKIIISELPNIGRIYKVKCKCTHDFSIQFDRRKHKRKRINFIGTYSVDDSFVDSIINIIDISRGGLAFIRTEKNKLNIGDKIHIKFNLDNPNGDLIDCIALIRNIFDNRVCVEFIEIKGRGQTTLGFYLF